MHKKKRSTSLTIIAFLAIVLFLSSGQPSLAANLTDVDESHWAYGDVQSLMEKNVLNGYSNGTFKPDESVTRAQAAKVISLAADIKPVKPEKASYPDVAPDYWAFEYIEALKKAGVIHGKGNGMYGPSEVLTRGQMAKILAESFGLVGRSTNYFEDVKPADWMFTYVLALRDSGITVGYSQDNTYRPDGIVTRAQMAAFANRAMEWKGEQVPSGEIIAFGDSNTSGSYLPKEFSAYPDHNWPKLAGITNAGVSGNTTASALKRFETDVLDRNPSAVVMMFGLNDALIRPDTKEPQVSKVQFEENISYMTAQLKAKDIEVVWMTNLPVIESIYYQSQAAQNPDIQKLYAGKGGLRAWEDSYNEIIRKVAKQQNVGLIDNYANAVQKAGSATDADLKKSGLIDPLLGFHWTPRGHMMVEYSVSRYLE
ncbi:S-layer homology domain-containing protein [Planococcus sp. 4-30]|uniref:S-layer homology domain-containing protein n=1 Tax=Planococcus sp. 4-30 TaxID=2874583 RepID=UPI001CBB8B0F|nr:S-layer homology domain-containing protein [Planococcus sp. 4-30]